MNLSLKNVDVFLLTVTCPTTTTPSGNPTVQFEKDQYWSEVIENSQVNTALVTLVARSSSSERPQYDLLESILIFLKIELTLLANKFILQIQIANILQSTLFREL